MRPHPGELCPFLSIRVDSGQFSVRADSSSQPDEPGLGIEIALLRGNYRVRVWMASHRSHLFVE